MTIDLPEYLPEGSEGPLHTTIWTNPNESHMAAYTISIFGDLRDYDDSREIMHFFTEYCKGKMIRSGIVEIDIEYHETLVYRYDSESEVWTLISE